VILATRASGVEYSNSSPLMRTVGVALISTAPARPSVIFV
jgi:hypothetical protein